MSRRRFPLLAATLAFPLLAAATCGDNLPAPTVHDYLIAREQAGCERLVRCGVFSTVDSCAAYFPSARETELERAISAGTVQFDANEVTRCLATVAAASCDETTLLARDPQFCFALFHGTLDVGATCSLDDECVSGSCATANCEAGKCCLGTCEAVTPPVLAAAGAECRRDTDCVLGTGCVGAGIDPGTCRALPLIGEACPYRRCAELGAHCADNLCVADGAGSTCGSDSDCAVYNQCGADDVCGSPPDLGEPCATVCEGDSFCRRPTGQEQFGTCTAPQDNGAPCLSDSECESRYCAEGAFFDTCAERETCF